MVHPNRIVPAHRERAEANAPSPAKPAKKPRRQAVADRLKGAGK